VGVIGALTASQLAFLTDEESTYNTFTIGDVGLDVIEPNYPGNNSDEVTHIVPNEEIAKDPQLVNTGDNDAVAFAEFSIPIVADLITADDSGLRQEAKDTEIFTILNSTGAKGLNEGWTLIKKEYVDADGNVKMTDTSGTFSQEIPTDAQGLGAVKAVYTVAYNKILSSTDDGDTTDTDERITAAVFDKVKLVNLVEGQIDNTAESIEVTGLAIQSDWLGSNLKVSDADDAAKVTNDKGELVQADGTTPVGTGDAIPEASLKKIYDMYMNQQIDKTATDSDADSSNALNLKGEEIGTKLTVADSEGTTWGSAAIATFPSEAKIKVTAAAIGGETGETVDRTITVESNNENVATVTKSTTEDDTWIISAKQAGYVTITAKTADGAVVSKQITVGNPTAAGATSGQNTNANKDSSSDYDWAAATTEENSGAEENNGTD
jgi:hypothetical protein